MDKHTSYSKSEAKALRDSAVIEAVLTSPATHFDSADDASVFFARELDHVKSQSYDVQYPEFTALETFPITHDADPGAETVTYYTYDKQGMAKIIDNYSTDLPRTDVNGKPSTAVVKSIGDSYGYSAQEMRASRMAGKSLDSRKAESARYAIDNKTNQIAWIGDDANGLLGVLSTAQNIPVFTVTAGASGGVKWEDKTADEILADITAMQRQVAKTTKNVERPDTLMLPSDVYLHIANKRINDTSTTVLKYILDNAPYIKEIISAAELNSDSVETNPYASETPGSAAGVAFFFTNSEKKLALENPMPFYQYPLQVRNLETVIPCEARTAGVIVYYPMSALIAVGV